MRSSGRFLLSCFALHPGDPKREPRSLPGVRKKSWNTALIRALCVIRWGSRSRAPEMTAWFHHGHPEKVLLTLPPNLPPNVQALNLLCFPHHTESSSDPLFVPSYPGSRQLTGFSVAPAPLMGLVLRDPQRTPLHRTDTDPAVGAQLALKYLTRPLTLSVPFSPTSKCTCRATNTDAVDS